MLAERVEPYFPVQAGMEVDAAQGVAAVGLLAQPSP